MPHTGQIWALWLSPSLVPQQPVISGALQLALVSGQSLLEILMREVSCPGQPFPMAALSVLA